MPQKSVTAIYCDDIRNEVGGKLSFMGVYSADMYLPGFPVTLPKLCVFVTVKIPHNEYPKDQVKIQIVEGKNELSLIELDELSLEQNRPQAQESNQESDIESNLEEKSFALSVGFTLSPFQLQAPTNLKVRAYVDGEEIKANSLKIRLPNEEERKLFAQL